MSEIIISVETIKAIEPHPQADRLEIAKILGTQVVVPKGEYQAGDAIVYFPPDMLIPAVVSEVLGVQKYLKTATFEGLKIPCRVAACRLRTIASYGFIARLPPELAHLAAWAGTEQANVTGFYAGQKYEPPHVTAHNSGGGQGRLAPECPMFHEYTDIQNYYRHPDAIPVGTIVRVTEKIHGTNSRVGCVYHDGEFQFMAGSHHTNRSKETEGHLSIYWRPLEIEGVLNMLNTLCGERRNIVVFGELYGPGIQDMDYGIPAGDVGFRVFDITHDGDYLDWDIVKAMCHNNDVELAPLLYQGPFSHKMVEALTDGPTTLISPEGIKSKFKGREGIVITPVVEAYSDVLRGRMILKSKSADYLDRKNAQDNGEAE
jgi:RNA ligase (TIGR02306 family)